MRLKRYHCGSFRTVRPRLRQWFSSQPGKWLLDAEQEVIGEKLADLFGYHILQLGRFEDRELLAGSRITHRIVLDIEANADTDKTGIPVASPAALPFAEDSLDVVVMPHVLEFEPDSHQILREAQRVLIPEGYLLLTGFNPWSLWGLWSLLLGWRQQLPWCGHFLHQPRIRDWLSLLGFEILETNTVFFRPPFKNARVMDRLTGMERAGARLWRYFGAAWVIVAQKKVVTLTPIRPSWNRRRSLLASGVVEPTTRDAA